MTHPKDHLPPCIGRTKHRDVWHVNDPDPTSFGFSVSREDWESWHLRHAEKDRITATGLCWRAPTPLRVGNIYLPQIRQAESGTSSRASWYSDKSSVTAARQGARDAVAVRRRGPRGRASPLRAPSVASQDL